MRHAGRMIDQGFNTAKAFGQGKKPGARKQCSRGFHAVQFQFKTDHSSKILHLAFGHCMAWMIFKPWPVHFFDGRMGLEEMCNGSTILAMPFHPDAQGFYAPEYQKTIHRPRYGPTAFLDKVQFIPQGLIVHHQSTLYYITVTTKVFCCRMHHDVCAERKRILEGRRCKRIVHAKQDLVFLCYRCNAPDVGDVHQRIGGRFRPDQFCIGIDFRLNIAYNTHVYIVKNNPEFAVYLAEKPVGSTIHVTGCNDFIARFQQLHHCIGCRNPTAKCQSEFTFFNHCQSLFQRCTGRVLRTGIFIAFVNTK